ncbi:hypothetical protein CPB83DRAFT_881781 [Crepidotus variabilis]|uniref:Uncharacterized protein n=1 Tax=Crepidotus variabilis TaxID=179855 RepID=A0A9P6EKP2_9AGAR|nr:hypothetical protein CPB83DRAFT_881781 [Crepidotus variabilis]
MTQTDEFKVYWLSMRAGVRDSEGIYHSVDDKVNCRESEVDNSCPLGERLTDGENKARFSVKNLAVILEITRGQLEQLRNNSWSELRWLNFLSEIAGSYSMDLRKTWREASKQIRVEEERKDAWRIVKKRSENSRR